MLEKYLAGLPASESVQAESVTAFHFCADEDGANRCSALVAAGKKTATCSLRLWYHGDEAYPEVGNISVVTNWRGESTSIIKTVAVRESRFCDVGEEFAAAEGEGDGSLRWWRDEHRAFFSRECEEMQLSFDETMLLVLETFQVVAGGMGPGPEATAIHAGD